MLINELKKLQQEHHLIITENNNVISKLTKELNDTYKNTNSKNYDDFANLNDQLIECSKQNQHLNSALQKLTVSDIKIKNNIMLLMKLFVFRLKMRNCVRIRVVHTEVLTSRVQMIQVN